MFIYAFFCNFLIVNQFLYYFIILLPQISSFVCISSSFVPYAYVSIVSIDRIILSLVAPSAVLVRSVNIPFVINMHVLNRHDYPCSFQFSCYKFLKIFFLYYSLVLTLNNFFLLRLLQTSHSLIFSHILSGFSGNFIIHQLRKIFLKIIFCMFPFLFIHINVWF